LRIRKATFLWLCAAIATALSLPARGQVALNQESVAVDAAQTFDAWLADFIVEARSRGYSSDLIAGTVAGLEPLHRVVASDRSQAELKVGFERYLSSRLTPVVVRRGRELARQHRTTLNGIENKYDVQRRFMLSIWGMETRFGRVTGRTPIFQALATLAWEPRRAAYFRGELFNALAMVDKGYIDAPSMTGSWAGAMGQPQFMPSSYLQYAVDHDGDGRRDIWRSTPDALASIANYLKGWGWKGDETWGREVQLTSAVREQVAAAIPTRAGDCFAMRNMTERRPLAEWAKLGVRLKGGRPLPRAGLEAGLVETDSRSFLVYTNYDALLRYNCAHYYALSVALLADRLQ
jgi:membrane-bound lytic murein transglycosylase B